MKKCLILCVTVWLFFIIFVVLPIIFIPKLLFGDLDKYKAVSKYTENEVIDLVNLYVSETTKDNWKYSYKVIDKKPLEVCVRSWNVCEKYKIIEDAYQYVVEVTDTTTDTLEARIIVEDKYKKNGKLISNIYVDEIYYVGEYKERYQQLLSLLNSYDSMLYILFNDETAFGETKKIQYGFIYSPNVADIESLLNKLAKEPNKYYWDFIITNNKDVFAYTFLGNMIGYNNIFDKYNVIDTMNKVDLSAFNNDSNVLIENSSKDGVTIVNSILKKYEEDR